MPKINLLSVAIGAAAVYAFMYWRASAQAVPSGTSLSMGPGPVKLNT